MQVGDPIYEVGPSGFLTPSVVSEVHSRRDQVLAVDSRGFHMALAPGHRVVKIGGQRGKANRRRELSLVPFDELPGQVAIARTIKWTGQHTNDVLISRPEYLRKTRTPQPEMLTGIQWAALLGWFLSEGSLVVRDRAVSIAQSKRDTRNRLRLLLEDCGFKVSWSDHGATIYAVGLFERLAAGKFGFCRDKYVPREVLEGTPAELRAFFTAVMDGDGHWATRDQSGTYYTASKRLADDVAEVAVKLGHIVSSRSRQRVNRVGPAYEVSFKRTKNGGTELLTGQHVYRVNTRTQRRSDISEQPERDMYCIGTPLYQMFVIRQRGSVWASGDSSREVPDV